MTDLSFITRRYFYDFADTSLINSGWCFVWAWMARVHLGAAFQLCTALQRRGARGHAFGKVGKLYVDADRPRGVTAYAMLPAIADVGRDRDADLRMSPDRFLLTWETSDRSWRRFADQGLRSFPTSIPRKPRLRRAA
jgi:hypothetical protein